MTPAGGGGRARVSSREPPALVPSVGGRLVPFVLLGTLGTAQWVRMSQATGFGRGVVWVALGTLAAGAVWACDRLPERGRALGRLAVAVVALLVAVPAAGLDAELLKPARWGRLLDGLAGGADVLGTSALPYLGADPWPSRTIALLGAVLCVVAGLLLLWPRPGDRGYRFLSLAALFVLVVAPVVSMGGTRPVLLGCALTALTVAFLWLERLPLRPGAGVAALLGIALAGALPLSAATDREDPWFDYSVAAGRLASERPVRFAWQHTYGPITWPRERREVMRIRSARPQYWKAETLDDFSGDLWGVRPSGEGGGGVGADLPADPAARAAWTVEASVSVRRLRSADVIGTGTVLEIAEASRRVRRAEAPGAYVAEPELRRGDSYRVRAYAPRPPPALLATATSGVDGRQADDLVVDLPIREDVDRDRVPRTDSGIPARAATVTFAPFGEGAAPRAEFPDVGLSGSGAAALRLTPYARTWALARRLRERSGTPYEYVRRIAALLSQPGFVYTETPAPLQDARAPLDAFLFDTRAGYCQHYSGAMALLLRMGGVPARVATGFSPGGFSRKRDEWVVRDTDAHSWVEVWLDRDGWVTVDPTPPATPARSQTAAIASTAATGGADGEGKADGAAGAGSDERRDPRLGPTDERPAVPDEPGAETSASRGGDRPAGTIALVALLGLGLAGAGVAGRRALRDPLRGASAAERSVAELEAAFRRAGRPTAPGTTLRQIEERLQGSAEAAAYVRALRHGRYAAVPVRPSAAGRRAVRRELAYGLGLGGRLRALWALPPRVASSRRRRRRSDLAVTREP